MMPHVGVYLRVEPNAGGSYQYVLSVLRGLEPLRAAGWRLTAFAHDESWRAELPDGFSLVHCRGSADGALPSLVFRRLVTSPAAARLAGGLDPTIRLIDGAGCDLVVFPGQDAAAYQTRTRALATVHDLMHRYESQFEEYHRGEYEGRERHYRRLCVNAAGILVDSELGRRHVVESYSVSPDKVFVLPFAPPEYLERSPRVDVRAKYGLFERYLFYPAQFWEHKNHLRLLEAVARAKRDALAPKLVLCGSRKNAYDRVVSAIATLGLAADVKILGYVPNEDMRSLYEEAVATVFVSRIGPTSIPPLEAMFVGCPLVLSNIYANPEQVGDAALLVDPTSTEEIADAIARVWTDEGTRRELVERGRARSARWTSADFGERLRQVVGAMV
jgi:glycosyltransferase involved in cell wall biosynthesis